MKKSEKLRHKTRNLIIKNLIILIALAVVAFVGVFSWFTNRTTATANGLSISTEVIGGLEYFIVAPNSSDQYSNINSWISSYNTEHASETGFVAKGWHEGAVTFDFSDPEFKFMEDMFMCETTSDGKSFKIPSLIQYGDIAYVDTTQAFEDATPNEEYMSFDMYFRSKSSYDVVLKYNSSIIPKTAVNTSTEEGVKAAAIGAVRMSVVNNNTRELLWIPAPRVWFDGTANNGEGLLHTNYTGTNNNFKPGGNVTLSGDNVVLTGDGTNEHWYYTELNGSRTRVKDPGSDIVASTSGDYSLGANSSADRTVVTLSHHNNDGYYYNHVRINLWIEGEDAESRLKFVGGKFNMSLIFDTISNS